MEQVISVITPAMAKKTADKFVRWDEVLKKNFLNGTGDQVTYAFQLLDDPTIFMYAFFKNKEGGPMMLYPYQDHIINDLHKRVIFCAANQIGKASRWSSLVYTPVGPKIMKDIRKGDFVMGEDGLPHKVLSTHEQGVRPVYKLTFDDGSFCECDRDHLWKVILPSHRFKYRWSHGKKELNPNFNKYTVLSLKDLIARYGSNPKPVARVVIPVCQPVVFDERRVVVHPYVIGALLGDGGLSQKTVHFTSADEEIVIGLRNHCEFNGWTVNKLSSEYAYSITGGINKKLSSLGLIGKRSKSKFIPKVYLYNSISCRVNLLRGLMDTDGSIYGKGVCEYSTVSKQLALDVKELVCSLGGKAKISVKKSSYVNKQGVRVHCLLCYRVMIKLERINLSFLRGRLDCIIRLVIVRERFLRSIRFVDYDHTKCIVVDSVDHTYLTDDFIVTHNSVTLCCKAVHFALTNPGKTVLMTSKTLPQSKDLLREIKRLLNSCSLDYKANIGDSENRTEIYFRHFEKYLDDGVERVRELSQSRIICVPATEAALGYPADLALPDELAFYEDGRRFYFQILQPRTYTTKGQIMTFSNPNGQQGVYWELWNDPDFHRYQFNYLDKPGNTQDEWDKLRKRLTKEEFDSTVNAVFTSPAGGFFNLQERKGMQEERPNILPDAIVQPLYIFFDWGKSMDRTVRSIGIPMGAGEDMGVYIYENYEYPQKTPYNEIVDDLKALIKSVGFNFVAMVGWDNTGVGKGIEDFIKKIEEIGVTAMPVEFSLQNKSRIYTLLKLLAEKNVRGGVGIKMPYVIECDNQLAKLRFKRSDRGYWKIHHDNESDRDDFPDAIAGLCSLIIQPDNPPVSAVIIGADDSDVNITRKEGLGFIPN